MKFRKLWLDGYGRFTGRTVDLKDGFQVVLGRNEQGKTTLRRFIGDMLYGQKSSATQRRYDEAERVRKPWDGASYAGRLLYELEDGCQFEVQRNFDRKNESVQVFDRTHAQEVTGQFETLRNREPSFAQSHLGLTKAVFLNVANIGHFGLESLGDGDALTEIREKILSLTDSDEGVTSADRALKSLEAHAAVIGRPIANSKKPLPAAQSRLAALQEEQREALAVRHEMAESEQRLRGVREEVAALTGDLTRGQAQLAGIEKVDRAERLEKAEDVSKTIDEITQECFKLGAARDFPLDQEADFQRTATLAEAARQQAKRTQDEQADLRNQLEEEAERLGPAGVEICDIAPETEERLAEVETQATRLRGYVEEIQEAQSKAEERMHQAEEELAGLPEFDRFDADPVTWLNNLGTSFTLALQRRENDRQKLDALGTECARREMALAHPDGLFDNFEDFSSEARDYDYALRQFDGHQSELRSRIEQVEVTAQDHDAYLPKFRFLAVACFVAAVSFSLMAYFFANAGIFIPAAACGLGFVFFLVQWSLASTGLRRATEELDAARQELDHLGEEHFGRTGAMETILQEGHCETFRELEALYERYMKDRNALSALRQAFARQGEIVAARNDEVAALFAERRETFSQLGEAVEEEGDVEEVAKRAISRYQVYRDAKRRRAENQDQFRSLNVEVGRLKEQLAGKQQEDRELSLQVRQVMREAGYREEANHTSALSALRAYRIRTAQMKQKRGRLDVLQEQVAILEARLDTESGELAEREAALKAFLEAGGVDSAEAYRDLAAKARTYQQAWAKRNGLQEQLATLLRDEDLESLRASVEAAGPAQDAPGCGLEELKRDLARLAEEVDARTKEAHALELAIAEQSAGIRPIAEIEEDHAAAAHRLAELELEREAATYAAVVIEEAARDKHARVAPRLAEVASTYLRDITDGAYSELFLSRDLSITVRIPQTDRLDEAPEQCLSKGTVDQIYLALRLALVQSLSGTGEPIPMLLDDPFANYDDHRLAQALRLLAGLFGVPQILLFTCREDVAAAAREAGTPVLEL